MSGKSSSSLKELRNLRGTVLAEEKARTQAKLQNLPGGQAEDPQTIQEFEPSDSDATDSEEMAPAPPPPTPSRPPTPPPPAARAVAAPPSAPIANRPKASPPKDPALIIPLTPKMQERLQRNVESARWSPAELVMELIRVSLHRGYPTIEFGDQVIARAGTYRTIERNPFDAVLKIISGQGVFSIAVRPENPEFQRWLAHFEAQESANPEKSANQVCLFSLQSYLENVEDFRPDGWAKVIPEDAYSLDAAL